uniref:Uncharacterized protein n=1 Tax=Craspedostauros australis TaxID=1486917 RepID=A0A7R9WYA0_9STRA|mmetsp:Transcript_3434/g.9116  ORF Transcript_3434/g.9116 Transcript_3434/m.9116 type:complete len:118 (+) Transcript_3434:280-633(+)
MESVHTIGALEEYDFRSLWEHLSFTPSFFSICILTSLHVILTIESMSDWLAWHDMIQTAPILWYCSHTLSSRMMDSTPTMCLNCCNIVSLEGAVREKRTKPPEDFIAVAEDLIWSKK